jgi:hypothetical protein
MAEGSGNSGIVSSCDKAETVVEPEVHSTVSPTELLHTAILIADTVRRYEQQSLAESATIPTTWFRLQTFFEVPGVSQGCAAACCGLALMIPVRRSLLRVCDKHWNLGTAFPDLVITPMLAIYLAQCSLWIGSLYGSSYYLNKLASIPTTKSSQTADTICNDPSVINASRLLSASSVPHALSNNPSIMRHYLNEWDPQRNVSSALHDAVRSCQERREYFNKEKKVQSR